MPDDSLDLVELVMTIEEVLPDLDSAQREQLSREIAARIANGEIGDDDFDDDALASLVRKLGPRSPRGQAGAAAQPEKPLFE